MRRAAPNREAWFERLVDETRADLLAYVLRRVRNPEDAADVLAETLLTAWQKLDSVPRGPDARLWLFGVARNMIRRGRQRERVIDAVVQQLAGEICDAASRLRVLEEERSPELWAALRVLPEPQREVILLTAWEELTPREIATVTGTPVNVVRVRLHRARSRLQQNLRDPTRADEETSIPRAAPAALDPATRR